MQYQIKVLSKFPYPVKRDIPTEGCLNLGRRVAPCIKECSSFFAFTLEVQRGNLATFQ